MNVGAPEGFRNAIPKSNPAVLPPLTKPLPCQSISVCRCPDCLYCLFKQLCPKHVRTDRHKQVDRYAVRSTGVTVGHDFIPSSPSSCNDDDDDDVNPREPRRIGKTERKSGVG